MSISFIIHMIASAVNGNQPDANPQDINTEIERAKLRAAKRINRAKMRAQEELGELDRIRVTVMSSDMKKFTHEFNQIQNVQFDDCSMLTGLEHFNKEHKNWKDLENLYTKAAGVVSFSGALDAIGFGAGVLDQYAQVPVLHAMNEKLSMEGLESMTKELQNYGAKVKKMCRRMQDIRREARQAEDALLDLDDYLQDGIDDIKSIMAKSGKDWTKYSLPQKILIGRTAQVSRLIRALSEIRFLKDNADLRPEIREALEASDALLDELGT
jgi:hypothetical protein